MGRRRLPLSLGALLLLALPGAALRAQPPPPGAVPPPPGFDGSLSPDIYTDDITYTLRAAFIRGLTVSPHDPAVAYVGSYDGYVWKTTDGGLTWDESRLIPETRPFYGDAGERLYFGIHRTGGPGGDTSGPPDRNQAPAVVSAGGGGGGGGGGAAANVNFGIGLPGGAPRLQNLVRKFGKPTAGLNIKQTLAMRGTRPSEVRVIVVHPKDPNTVFACSAFGLYRTTDGGVNWVRVYTGTKPGDRFAFHLAVDPKDPKRILMGTGDGMWISIDGGESFAKATAGGVGGGAIFWVYFNPYDPNYVFAGTGDGLLRSADNGRTWDYIYFTTFPPARLVLSVELDPFDRKTGYIATLDGLFKTPDLLKGGLESWDRLGGLQFSGIHSEKIRACPQHKGHLWAYTNMRIASVTAPGTVDTGGAFIMESLDGGDHWRVINAGNTNGSMQWFDNDPKDPDLVWIAWSRSVTRMRRRAPGERAVHAHMVIPDDPPIYEVIMAAQMYHGTDPGRQTEYRRRSIWKALVPRVSASWSSLRWRDFSMQRDGFYPNLPFRFDRQPTLAQNEFRVFASWDLSDLVFNLDSILFGRIDRLNYEVREVVKFAMHRLYGELRRLKVLMKNGPPKDLRTSIMYKLRIQELTSYVNLMTGNYLTHWRQGGRTPGFEAPWWKPFTTRR